MEYIECETHEALSERAADLVVQAFRRKPNLVYTGPSGDTATLMHKIVGRRYRAKAFSSAFARLLQLDEWCGVAPSNPRSCQFYTRLHIKEPLDIPEERFLRFDGDASDWLAECRRVEQGLRDWGNVIHLAVLGLGLDMHVALNQGNNDTIRRGIHAPKLSATSATHSMLRGLAVTHGMTVGLADLLRAEHLIMLVSGPHKVRQLHQFMYGDKSPLYPALMIRDHPNLTVMYDRRASNFSSIV